MLWICHNVFTPFTTMFIAVFLMSFQQLNVMRDNRKAVIPVSLCLSLAEVLLISTIAKTGFGWICLPIGLGGGCGCLVSMSIHKKWFNNVNRKTGTV